jgi:hypothetical protein
VKAIKSLKNNLREKGSDTIFGHKSGEMRKRPVKRPLGVIRKTAGRKLPVFQMILQTLTTGPFSRTGFIAAVAFAFVLLQVAIHTAGSSPSIVIQKRSTY